MKNRTIVGIMLSLLVTTMLTLALNIQPVKSNPGVLFSDDFNDNVADGWTEHLGTWSVIDGEYSVSVGIVENGISTVDSLTLSDYVIEANLRFTDSVGFRAGIVFRYTDNAHYYAFEPSNEYDDIGLIKYTPENSGYGTVITSTGNWAYPIERDTDYLLKVIVQGDTFTCFINGEEVISGSDGSYTTGKVGLRARRADVFFDDFTVYGIEPIQLTRNLSIKLSGDFDYSSKEKIKVKVAALVKDADTMEGVSDANVTVEIYYQNGTLWISDNMAERLAGTGIYEWESSETIYAMDIEDGIFLAHVKASIGEGPVATDMLLIHIDPPGDSSTFSMTPLIYYVTAIIVIAAGTIAGVALLRKHRRSQMTPQ